MAFKAEQLDATLINNNTEYQEGDALQPSTINDMIEGILHNQENGGSGLTEEEKAKLDTIKTNGDGTKYLADDGTYKEVESGSSITVDSELSTESENPVQNKVVTEELNKKVKYPTNYEQVKWGTGPYLVAIQRKEAADGTMTYTESYRITNPYYLYDLSANPIPAYKEAGKTFANSDTALEKLKHTIFIADCNDKSLRYEAVNKGYVDDNKGTKLYKHTWLVNCKNPNTNTEYVVNIHFYAVSQNVALKYSDEYEIAIEATNITNLPYIEIDGNGKVTTDILHFGDNVPCYDFSIYDVLSDKDAIIISIEPQYVGV